MPMDNVNDIMSLLTILLFIFIPIYILGKQLYTWIEKKNQKRLERYMQEDDWHM